MPLKSTCKALFLYSQVIGLKIESRIHLSDLFDVYRGLLTQKQTDMFELYYHYDLSLAEIAANCQISRQGVADLLRRTARQLNRLEQRLQLVAKDKLRQQLLAGLEQALAAEDYGAAGRWLRQLKNS